MSLTHVFESLLLENKARKVITQKLNLPEEIYQYLVDETVANPKRYIFYANLFKDDKPFIESVVDIYRVQTGDINKDDIDNQASNDLSLKNRLFRSYRKYIEDLEEFLTEPNKPNISLKELSEKLKHYNGGFSEPLLEFFLSEWTSIKDWRDRITPTPNLQSMSFDEAYEESSQWHRDITSQQQVFQGEINEVAPDAEIIHTFDNGFRWVDMKTNDCSKLGSIMGHCAKTRADTLLNLVTDKGDFVVTVSFDYDGAYTQAKGKGNDKPHEKYTKYMLWLFENGGDYQLKSYETEYASSDDFKVEDLEPLVGEDRVEEILSDYPDLEKPSLYRGIEKYESGDTEKGLEMINEIIYNADIIAYKHNQLISDEEADSSTLEDANIIDDSTLFYHIINRVEIETGIEFSIANNFSIVSPEIFDWILEEMSTQDFVSFLKSYVMNEDKDGKFSKVNDDFYMGITEIVSEKMSFENKKKIIRRAFEKYPSRFNRTDITENFDEMFSGVFEKLMTIDKHLNRKIGEAKVEKDIVINENINTSVEESLTAYLSDFMARTAFTPYGDESQEDEDRSVPLKYYRAMYMDPDEAQYIDQNFNFDSVSHVLDYDEVDLNEHFDDIKVLDKACENIAKVVEAKAVGDESYEMDPEEVLFYLLVEDVQAIETSDYVGEALYEAGYLDADDVKLTNKNQLDIFEQ